MLPYYCNWDGTDRCSGGEHETWVPELLGSRTDRARCPRLHRIGPRYLCFVYYGKVRSTLCSWPYHTYMAFCSASLPEGRTTSFTSEEKHVRVGFRRFDCLGRRIIVPKPDDFTTTANVKDGDDDESCKQEEEGGEKGDREGRGRMVQLIPGMLRSYDTSTGLFGIRYSFGNR